MCVTDKTVAEIHGQATYEIQGGGIKCLPRGEILNDLKKALTTLI